jgi:hypothetical protein
MRNQCAVRRLRSIALAGLLTAIAVAKAAILSLAQL